MGKFEIGWGERLVDYFHALAQRLARVCVLNRGWEQGVTPTILSNTKSVEGKFDIAVFLDPPYKAKTTPSAIPEKQRTPPRILMSGR